MFGKARDAGAVKRLLISILRYSSSSRTFRLCFVIPTDIVFKTGLIPLQYFSIGVSPNFTIALLVLAESENLDGWYKIILVQRPDIILNNENAC